MFVMAEPEDQTEKNQKSPGSDFYITFSTISSSPYLSSPSTSRVCVCVDGPPSCSCLTTKELQQNLKAVKRNDQPVKLLFEIPSTRIIEKVLSKYVVYEVVVMRSGTFDLRRVSVERRYSDFLRLHRDLLEEFQEELEDVVLPRKLLSRNFCPEAIAGRRLALQDYLADLYATRCVRHSPHFHRFLTQPEQRRAHGLLRAGRFLLAVQQLQDVLEIEEKLLPWQNPTLTVPTLSALAVCYRDLKEPERAFAAAQRALPPTRRYGLNRYRASLLELLVDLGYQLGCPVAQLQEELSLLRERGEVNSHSLKELVVHEFT
nr:sorting nexin-20 isoform X2 [Gasterosteus aculeatus aculeatus]XP_040018687.1 sorting nexin-20 isoform X2 [Gasterosteus aculeatus aculeatus]XP_040018688.1 sorting nexin-20 isoform X2 [Gasterosteus aculeatus aculeatus]XP_040018689.1 sorting nexin-20 isoform X2 [Gasterosteus aculeatus aculeatus]